jgi:hypothetical protein
MTDGKTTWRAQGCVRALYASSLPIQCDRKVIGADVQSLAKVETVCVEALDTGVEIELPAALRAGEINQPIEQKCPVAG